MPTPLDVQFAGSGSDVAAIDQKGNLTLKGSATVGSYLALPALATPPVQVPGEAILYSPDGRALTVVDGTGAATPLSFGSAFAATVLAAPLTVTGSTAKTPLLAAPALPSGALTAGQEWRVTAWGSLTTTLAAQTVTFEVDFGGTSVMGWGAQQPNSGGTETGSAWFWDVTLLVQAGPDITGAGMDSLAFFPSGTNQQIPTAVTNTGTQGFSIQLTNSATAVSVTCNGASIRRVN